jgi:hypothetical protein
MTYNKNLKCVYLDPQTNERLKVYQNETGLSRSSAIKVLIWQALGGRCEIEQKQQ